MTGDPRAGELGWPGLLALGALAAAWEVLGRLDVSFFIPPFSRVAAVWWELVADGTLPRAAAASLRSLVLGFVPAAVLGVALGLAMGRFPLVRHFFQAWVDTLMSAPLSALVPVLIALFGIRDTVVAASVFMFSFFVVVVNTEVGVRSTERSLLEMARAFGAGEAALFARISLPWALPAVLLGLRLGAVQALKGMVVGEMLISLVGLGERLIYYGNTFLITHLYAVILSVLALAVLTSQAASALDRALIRWK